MISYSSTLDGITPEQISGFFEGWPTPPTPETHLDILRNSSKVLLALDRGRVIGFITAITDNVLCAYIPLLEVLPEYRHHGVGHELVKGMLKELEDYYMVDLLCDPGLQEYYEELGMKKATGMMLRNYDKQSGRGK